VQQVLQLLRRTLYGGDEVSRPFESVPTEVRQLAEQASLNSRCSARTSMLCRSTAGAQLQTAALIQRRGRVPGIERIRFTTPPLEFSDR